MLNFKVNTSAMGVTENYDIEEELHPIFNSL